MPIESLQVQVDFCSHLPYQTAASFFQLKSIYHILFILIPHLFRDPLSTSFIATDPQRGEINKAENNKNNHLKVHAQT